MAGYQLKTDQGKTATELAVKHDNAIVLEHLWNDGIALFLDLYVLEAKHEKAFTLLQKVMLRWWQANVQLLWQTWWNRYQGVLTSNLGTEVAHLIHEQGEQACRHARQADFWTWTHGLAPFFWRGPEEFVRDLGIGFPPLWTAAQTQKIERQASLGEKHIMTMVEAKLQDVRMKGYVRLPDASNYELLRGAERRERREDGLRQNKTWAQLMHLRPLVLPAGFRRISPHP
ncbi:hypothetical protein ACA910_001928 [Epithemia clementina (nom. ined.)]